MPSSGSSSTPRRGRRTCARSRAADAPGRSRAAAADPPTPISWRRAPAGFVSGPSRLNAVRTPISRRVGPGVPHRRVEGRREQEREARPRASASPADSASWSMRTPSASSTSAEPAARGDRAVAVLGDRDAGRGDDERRGGRDVERARSRRRRSRTTSIVPVGASTLSTRSRMAVAKPASSSTVSPRIRSATSRPPAAPASPRRPSPRPSPRARSPRRACRPR